MYPKYVRLTVTVDSMAVGTALEVLPIGERLSAYAGPEDGHEVRIPDGLPGTGVVVFLESSEYEIID